MFGTWRSAKHRPLGVLIAIAGAGILVAACGSSSPARSSEASNGSATTVNVNVGDIPISACAPLYLGMKEGFFAQQHIHINPIPTEAGSTIIPAVTSGQEQFGFANTVSLLIAADKGLPVRIVSQGSQAGPGASSKFEGVIVPGNSSIKTPADLAGKTIAVNALNDIGGVLISGALQKLGVNTSGIHYTEVPFPQVNAAVAKGQVDAGYQTQPFLSEAIQSGDRVVLYQYPTLANEITIAMYFTTSTYQASHPAVVAGFRKAMNESLAYAQNHPAAVAAIIPTFTQIPSSVAKNLLEPSWNTSLNPQSAGLSLVAHLCVEQKLCSRKPDFSKLILK